eukprot:scaffold2830_cov131-Cylindrotheca_fusiformis.AAC.93
METAEDPNNQEAPPEEENNEIRTPLLHNDSRDENQSQSGLRHRGEARHPRLLDRDGNFHQSHGHWGVERLSRRNRRYLLSRLWHDWILGDWFHRLAYQRTPVLMFILFLAYTSIVVFFAFVYLGVSMMGRQTEINPDGSKKVIAFCDLEINDHMEALYFSLSTMTTIGYGVSDYYFGGCWTPLLLVLWQVCSAITFDAVAVGLLFHRISRGTKRGKTILFSDKAVVQRVKGVPYLMFRIGELRRYHLIEASVRCYCVRHERLPVGRTDSPRPNIQTTHFVSRQVKLLHPDENYGSHLWMGLPQVIVHRMDSQSPLVPSSPSWFDAQDVEHAFPRISSEEDCEEALVTSSGAGANTQSEEMSRFMIDRDMEIVVLVQGVDEATGATTQARHSYKTCDLAWDHTFESCVRPVASERQSSAAVQVDFSMFHDVLQAPPNAATCPYIP